MTNLMTVDSFSKNLALHEKSFNSVLPSHVNSKKFMRTVVGAVQANPDILECDQQSIFLSCQKAAQDGLVLDGREAALVPYKKKIGNQWVKCAQYQPMIDGILMKVRNSGQISVINAISVYEKDSFSYNPSVDELPNHSPDWFGDRGNFVGVYAFARLKDGSTSVAIMNKDEIEKIRKTSKSGTHRETGEATGIWRDWYEQKAQVACLKRLCRRLPSSADIDKLIEHDNYDYQSEGEVIDITPDNNQPAKPKRTAASQILQSKAEKAKESAEVYVDINTGEEIADPI